MDRQQRRDERLRFFLARKLLPLVIENYRASEPSENVRLAYEYADELLKQQRVTDANEGGE